MMNGLVTMLLAVVVLSGAYSLRGRYPAKKWGANSDAKTPVYEMEDGADYMPADTSVVFGHQFASIAGAGSINGPTQAVMFGWPSVVLWIFLGGIFFSAVQDSAATYASARSKGRSIGYIIEVYTSKLGKRLLLLSIWLFPILVVVAFADITAGILNDFDIATGERIVANGVITATFLSLIAFAVMLGCFLKYGRCSKLAGIPVTIGLPMLAVALGLAFPVYIPQSVWFIFVLLCVIATRVTSVWTLFQPRGYLNSYSLLATIIDAALGVCVYNPAINLLSSTSLIFADTKGNISYLSPTLFVTIIYGAVSDFRALVSSETVSKQIKSEKNMLPVSSGATSLENLLATTVLIAMGALATSESLPTGTPPQAFAKAIAMLPTALGMPDFISYMLIALSVSAFALTSLDSVARVGRIAFQGFFTNSDIDSIKQSSLNKVLTNKYFSTILTLALCYALSRTDYASIWPLFGPTSQLLSAPALTTCIVFLKKTHGRGVILWGPMVIMLDVTFTALTLKIKDLVSSLSNQFVFGDILRLVFATLLLILGVTATFEGIRKPWAKDMEADKTVSGKGVTTQKACNTQKAGSGNSPVLPKHGDEQRIVYLQ